MAWTFEQLLPRLDAATKVLVILGGVFTAWQYLEAKQTARIERTFEYVELLSRGEAAPARQAITAELLARQEQLGPILHGTFAPAEAQVLHARLAHFLVHQSRGGRGLALELDTLANLFQEITICVARKLCESEVAHAFLDETARNYWSNFKPYFLEQRTLIPTYAAGLEQFVVAAGER